MVQTGVFRVRAFADRELSRLRAQGFPAFLVAKNGLFYVRAGAFKQLDNAVRMERELRNLGYNTVIIQS